MPLTSITAVRSSRSLLADHSSRNILSGFHLLQASDHRPRSYRDTACDVYDLAASGWLDAARFRHLRDCY
ncbi:hypothetical protein BV20DRAFT_965360 [Pilatotrama ljubarskyi]|nr:hypothetical protein BV20DRAFT_965360 [Pilatotrama ljubarskyi]